MESAALFGCFLVIAILGYFFVGKVDRFLNSIQKDEEGQKQIYHLKIVASDFYAASSISNILINLQKKYPDLYCTLLVGKEGELLHYFENTNADMLIVSSDISYPRYPSKNICIEVQPFKLEEKPVILAPLDADIQQRKIFWKNNDLYPFISEFINQLSQDHV